MASHFGFDPLGSNLTNAALTRGLKRVRIADSTAAVEGDGSTSLIVSGRGPALTLKRLRGEMGVEVVDDGNGNVVISSSNVNTISQAVQAEAARAILAEAALAAGLTDSQTYCIQQLDKRAKEIMWDVGHSFTDFKDSIATKLSDAAAKALWDAGITAGVIAGVAVTAAAGVAVGTEAAVAAESLRTDLTNFVEFSGVTWANFASSTAERVADFILPLTAVDEFTESVFGTAHQVRMDFLKRQRLVVCEIYPFDYLVPVANIGGFALTGPIPLEFRPSQISTEDYNISFPVLLSVDGLVEAAIVAVNCQGYMLIKRDDIPFDEGSLVSFAGVQTIQYIQHVAPPPVLTDLSLPVDPPPVDPPPVDPPIV